MEEEFNPLDFCPSIVDLMLQHLSISEILVVSEVSSDFTCFIGSYRKFIKNVKLNFDEKRKISDKKFILLLKNMKRSFENLEIHGNGVLTKINLINKYYKGSWKCVKINDIVFNGPTILQTFIDSMRTTLEELSINSVFIFDCDKKITMSLPQLKRLEIVEGNDSENAFVKRVSFVINDCKTLSSLRLVYAGVSEENQKRLLEENNNLKELTLSDLPDSFFVSFASRINFKLEKFAIHFSRVRNIFHRPNFQQFLRLLTEDLKAVETVGCIDIEMLETFFKMPKLSSLTIGQAKKCLLHLNLRNIQERLVVSQSLKKLIFNDDLTLYPMFWLNLLEKTPNLNFFVIFNSSDNAQ